MPAYRPYSFSGTHQFHITDGKPIIFLRRKADHLQPLCIGGAFGQIFVRWDAVGHKQHFIQIQYGKGRKSHIHVAQMDRLKGTAQNADLAGYGKVLSFMHIL